MAQNEVITQDILDQSPNLVQMGAMVGDEIDPENFLVRKVSTKPTPKNEVITLEILRDSPNLRDMGALPGDEIDPENFLVRKFSKKGDKPRQDLSAEERSAYDNFMYGFNEQGSYVGNIASILERNFPIGRINSDFTYESPEELYGKEFGKASVDERRDMLARKRERELVEEYGVDEPEGVMATIGSAAKVLTDPLAIAEYGAYAMFPPLRAVKPFLATTGILSAGYSALEDWANKGEVDPVKAAAFGLGGVTLGVGGIGAEKLISKGIKKAANRRITDIEKKVNEHIKLGGSPNGALDSVLTPQTASRLQKDMQITGRAPEFAKSKTQAEELLRDQVVNDSAFARQISKPVDDLIASISFQLEKISPPLARRMKDHEFDIARDTHDFSLRAKPFMDDLKNLPISIKPTIARHLFNGDFEAAKSYMSQDMKNNFKIVREDLKKTFESSEEAGLILGKVENYFPRNVKDYDGLLTAIGSEKKDAIAKAQLEFAKKQGLENEAGLNKETKIRIANLVLRGYGVKEGATPKFAKPREFKIIPKELEKFYSTPEEALSLYIRNSVNNIHRRNFFGRGYELSQSNPRAIENSIGRYVQEARERGEITSDQVPEVTELLQARFIGGEQSAGNVANVIRDLGYAGTIANPISALTQLGDIAVSGALNGFRNTIAAMFNTKDLKAIDFGLDKIAQEFAEVRPTAKALDWAFSKTGFKAIDRIGKDIFLNASFRKNVNLLKKEKGEKQFRNSWGEYYGDDIEDVIADFKTGQLTETTKRHTFYELTNTYPLTPSENTKVYNQYPKLRLLYMLKNFTLAQWENVRREVIGEYKKGNKQKAIKTALAMAGYMSVAGLGVQTVKDFLLGRDVEVDNMPNTALWALLGAFGFNQYTSDKFLSRGEFTDYAFNLFRPATPIIDTILGLPYEATFVEDPNLEKYLNNVPIVGPIVYNWFGGGAEKYNERLGED